MRNKTTQTTEATTETDRPRFYIQQNANNAKPGTKYSMHTQIMPTNFTNHGTKQKSKGTAQNMQKMSNIREIPHNHT